MPTGYYQMTSPVATAPALHQQTDKHTEFYDFNFLDASLMYIPNVLSILCNDSFYHGFPGVARRSGNEIRVYI